MKNGKKEEMLKIGMKEKRKRREGRNIDYKTNRKLSVERCEVYLPLYLRL
jgi:hypothetical protein